MIKKVTSDFLSCGIQKLEGFLRLFFLCVFLFLWRLIQYPLKISENPGADPWLLSLWCHWHWWLLCSELIVDLKHFMWNFTFNSKSLCFTATVLSVYGHSFKSSLSLLDFSKFFLAMGVLNHIFLCYDHMLVSCCAFFFRVSRLCEACERPSNCV